MVAVIGMDVREGETMLVIAQRMRMVLFRVNDVYGLHHCVQSG